MGIWDRVHHDGLDGSGGLGWDMRALILCLLSCLPSSHGFERVGWLSGVFPLFRGLPCCAEGDGEGEGPVRCMGIAKLHSVARRIRRRVLIERG